MSNIQVMFSKKTDNWKTPKNFYERLIKQGYKDVAPFESDTDYLDLEWDYARIFINPPFSRNREFIGKAIETHRKYGNEIVLLLPVRTDTAYFKQLFDYGCHFTFITGRVRYNDTGSAPFPSVLVKLNGKINTIHQMSNREIN